MTIETARLRAQLLQQADEIARAGHAGWGNTMREAAETLAALLDERDALAADARRYRWLRDNAREELLRPETLGSEFADMRTHYNFPTVIAYAPYAGNVSMDESIDAALDGAKGE